MTAVGLSAQFTLGVYFTQIRSKWVPSLFVKVLQCGEKKDIHIHVNNITLLCCCSNLTQAVMSVSEQTTDIHILYTFWLAGF